MVGQRIRKERTQRTIDKNSFTSRQNTSEAFSSDTIEDQQTLSNNPNESISNRSGNHRVQFVNDRVTEVTNSRVNRVRMSYPKRKTNSTKLLFLRRKEEVGFGFSIRGGVEHGTGIFVSSVNKYSDAYTQGLQIGDQILRANNELFEGILHDEAVQVRRITNRKNA